jgi:hypothetical protein
MQSHQKSHLVKKTRGINVTSHFLHFFSQKRQSCDHFFGKNIFKNLDPFGPPKLNFYFRAQAEEKSRGITLKRFGIFSKYSFRELPGSLLTRIVK